MDTKTCSLCAEEKPLSEFHKEKNNSDGHQGKCKLCSNAQKRTKRELAATPEATWEEVEREKKAARGANINAQRYEFHKGQAGRLRSTLGHLVAHHEKEAMKYQAYSEERIVE